MRNIRTLAAVSVFSIIALASCGGRGSPGDVRPDNATEKILKGLQRCSYGALVVRNNGFEDFRLARGRDGSRFAEIKTGQDRILCVYERDLDQYEEIDLILMRLVYSRRRPGLFYEQLDQERISLKNYRVWRLTIEGSISRPLMRALPLSEEIPRPNR